MRTVLKTDAAMQYLPTRAMELFPLTITNNISITVCEVSLWLTRHCAENEIGADSQMEYIAAKIHSAFHKVLVQTINTSVNGEG